MCNEAKKLFGDDKECVIVSSVVDPVQEKQIVVIEVYGKPLDFDKFTEALEVSRNESS